jgi:hypothetical protein
MVCGRVNWTSDMKYSYAASKGVAAPLRRECVSGTRGDSRCNSGSYAHPLSRTDAVFAAGVYVAASARGAAVELQRT